MSANSTSIMHRSWFWPAVILGMLSAHVILWISIAILASSDRTFAVEPGYYQKAVAWDQTATIRANGNKLGWNLCWKDIPATTSGDQRVFRAILTNRVGDPLDGASIHVEAFSHANAHDRRVLSLAPLGNGCYETAAIKTRAGLWELRATVERGPDVYLHTDVMDLRTIGTAQAAGGPSSRDASGTFTQGEQQ